MANNYQVAVRLFNNAKYGTPVGKGKYRNAFFNSTIDIRYSTHKYLLDFYTYTDWENLAKTDGHMQVVKQITPSNQVIYSWIKHYDVKTKNKTTVDGFAMVDLQEMTCLVVLIDEPNDICEKFKLAVHKCKEASLGVKSPQYFAANYDLSI